MSVRDISVPGVAAQFFVLLVCGIVFSSVSILNPLISPVLGAALLGGVIYWYYIEKIEAKSLILFLIFLYPLLPSLWGLRLAPGMPVVRAHRILALLVIVFLLRRGLFLKYYSEYFRSKTFGVPVLCFIVSVLGSALFSGAAGSTLNALFSYFFESFILTVIVYSTFRTRDDIELLVVNMSRSVVVLCFLGLYETITTSNPYSIFGTFSDQFTGAFEHSVRGGAIRILGPFSHPIAFGTYFAGTLAMVLYRYRRNQLMIVLLIGFVFNTIIGTNSRGAQIGAIIVILYYLFVVDKNKKFIYILGIFPLLLSGSFRYRLSTLNPFFSGDAVLQDSSSARVDQFYFLKDYIKNNILFGHGLIPTPMRLRFLGYMRDNYHNTVDNLYLLIAYYYGLAGLFSWLFMFISPMIKPFIVMGKAVRDDQLLQLLMISLVAMFIINGVVALESFQFIFWIYMGIISRLITIYREKQSAGRDEDGAAAS